MASNNGLNLKIPRLSKNRFGVFYVRASYKQDNQRRVYQQSLRTKDPQLAKILALRFCLAIVENSAMTKKEERLEDIGKMRPAHEVALQSFEAKRIAFEQALQAKIAKNPALSYPTTEMTIKTPSGEVIEFDENNPIAVELAKEFLRDSRLAHEKTSLQEAIQMAVVEQNKTPVFAPYYASTPQVPIPPITIQEAFDKHIVEEARKLVPDTIKEKKVVIKDFITCFGNIPLNMITVSEITHRWRPLEYARPNQRPKKSRSEAPDNGSESKVQTLSLARLEKRRCYLQKFFNWAMAGGMYIHPKNPVQQKFAGKDEIRDETKSWAEFTEDDLKKLFGTKYLENLGAKPDWYWLPLMALLSGARLGEIAKLAVDEFVEIEGIHCYKIVRASAKNRASIRTIPVHSRLIELGLLEYVQAMRDRGEKRFVARDTLEKNKSKSTGKMWGIHVSDVGITDDTKVFHSFRSTAITDLHNTDAGHATIQRTTGHATEGTSGAHGGYVRGVKLIKLKETIEKLEYPVIDFASLKLKDPTFKVHFDSEAIQKTTPKAISHKLHADAKARRLARNNANVSKTQIK